MATNQEIAVADFGKTLGKMEKAFSSVLPPHIPPAKFMRTALAAVQNNPDILSMDRRTVIASIQKAAQDGLIIDGREAALVSFGGKCNYMPMVAGVLKKIRNTGQISTITAQVVKKNDKFSFNPSRDDVPDHNPDWFGDRGKMIGVYAVARMKDGGTVVEIMSMDDINKVRNVSRSKGGPWTQWFDEMAKKSVLRRIAKLLPSSSDVDQMFDHDNENYDLNQKPVKAPVVNIDAAVAAPKKTAAEMVIEGSIVNDDEPPMPEEPGNYEVDDI